MSEPSQRERLDRALVLRGHFSTRAQAEAAIAAGLVTVDGEPARKPSQKVSQEAVIKAAPAHPYVSRGGLKLAHALDTFGVDPRGRMCLDVGASTGGFTDVLLRRGADHVFAVDVGRGQLHPSLRHNPRVSDISPVDARSLTEAAIPTPPSLVVCDASFIGLAKVIERPLSLAAEHAELVALFKPQFEVGRKHVGRGGIVKDDAAIAPAFDRLVDDLAWIGWRVVSRETSPITGGDGNREWLIHVVRGC